MNFNGIRTNIAKKSYLFVIFQGGGGPDPLYPLWIGLCNKKIQARSSVFISVLCWTITPFHINWYDPREQLCCNGLHKRITGNETCCGNTVYNYTDGVECCRFDMYNTSTKICCDGVLYDHSTNTSDCCGQFMYDTSTTAGCCRKKLYDSQRQFCCTDKIYNKIGRQNNHGDCCGTEK